MSKNNEYQKLQKSWNRHPETQRAAEKRFYDNADEMARYKKKKCKKSTQRADHKHNYIDAVIYEERRGGKRAYNGKVCSICGKQHSKNQGSYLLMVMRNEQVRTEGLPVYKAVDDNTAIPLE